MSNKLKVILAAGAIGFNFASLANPNVDMQEKCYCIARAGQNDCGSTTHGCATLASEDFDCKDWKYVASGSCTEIGGSTVAGVEPQKQ